MKTILMIAAAAGLAVTCAGQLVPLPPSSETIGISVQPPAVNLSPLLWDNPQTLGAFRGISNSNGSPSLSTSAPAGLSFGTAMPASARQALDSIAGGGAIRVIFLAESALWRNSFGFTTSGNPHAADSVTIFNGIDGGAGSGTSNVQFGDHADVYTLPGEFAVDFWFSAAGSAQGATAGGLGGVYTLFNPSDPSNIPSAMWGQSPLYVDTWLPGLEAVGPVPTFIVGFEDWRIDRGGDGDYSDLVLGFQFHPMTGTPFAPGLTPMPEPATFPALGTLALLAMLGARLRARSKRPALAS